VRLLDQSTLERPSGVVLTDPFPSSEDQRTGTQGSDARFATGEGWIGFATQVLRGVTFPAAWPVYASNAHRVKYREVLKEEVAEGGGG
jgi:hypothetical protein